MTKANKTPFKLDPALSRLCREHNISLPKPHDTWRTLKDPPTGEICGLGMVFRGQALATNGIVVAILTAVGNIVFGHYDWFITDPDEPTLDQAASTVKTNKDKSLKQYNEFF